MRTTILLICVLTLVTSCGEGTPDTPLPLPTDTPLPLPKVGDEYRGVFLEGIPKDLYALGTVEKVEGTVVTMRGGTRGLVFKVDWTKVVLTSQK